MLSLSHVNEPTDFLSVINTCQELNELLHSKKTVGLMPLVSKLFKCDVIRYIAIALVINCQVLCFRQLFKVAEASQRKICREGMGHNFCRPHQIKKDVYSEPLTHKYFQVF